MRPRRRFRLYRNGAVFIAAMVGASGLAAQQTGTLTGQILDAQSGQPISSVQVFIGDLDIGVLTQQNGRYLLQNVPAGTHTLTAERIGYRTQAAEVTLGAGETVVQNLNMSEEALQLDEVVVTGTAGGTQRRAIGNAVGTVEAAEITERVAISSMQDLLSARQPGLDFNRSSGSVGAGSGMTIRGTGSFSLGAQPLIYIDGIRLNNEISAGPGLSLGAGEVSPLDDLNPEDIESIEVIKGPAAATLYGTEASAGVIQIITKRGEQGAPQFNLSIRQGVNYMPSPVERLGDQFSCRTSFSPPCPTEDVFRFNLMEEGAKYVNGMAPVPEGSAFGGDFFPWPDENIYRYGHAQQYNLDIRGGTESLRYFLSGNYQDEIGALWYNYDETWRGRANVTAVFSENFTLDVSTQYLQGDTRLADPTFREGGTWVDAIWGNGYNMTRISSNDTERGGYEQRRPDVVGRVSALRDYSRFTGSATLNHNIGDNFTHRLVFGIDRGWDVNHQIFPIDELAHYPQMAQGEVTEGRPTTTNQSFDWAGTLSLDLDEAWSFDTSVGAQYYAERSDEITLQGFEFASPLSRTINQTVISKISLNQSIVENKSLGFYVQEQVGWNDRAFVTGALRFDDNSAFGANFEAQIYPKISATWLLSDEGFWDIDFINQFRIRGAWGKAGRQPDTFARTSTFETVAGVGGTSAFWPAGPGNPEVGPEVSTEYELGFDLALADDRISSDFTYFYQMNEDALLGIPVPSSFGFPGSVDRNIGRIDAWGFEATVDARVFEGRDVAFDLTGTADYTNNEIKHLGEFTGSTSIAIGYPYPNVVNGSWIVEADFVESSPYQSIYGQAVAGLCDAGVPLGDTPQHGRVPGGEIVDCATEGRDVRLLHGPGFHNWTWTVGPTVTLAENRLQIYALAEGQHGGIGSQCLETWAHNKNHTAAAVLQSDPEWVLAHRMGFGGGAPGEDSRYKSQYDASFIKLRDVGARLSLPESLVSRFGGERASIAVSGRDMATLWRGQWDQAGQALADPEHGHGFGGIGSNCYQQPPLSSFNVTFRVTF